MKKYEWIRLPKKGDRVKCIDDKSCTDYLTKGNIYIIESAFFQMFSIYNPIHNDRIEQWFPYRFMPIDDACGDCINVCRSKEKCPFYKGV